MDISQATLSDLDELNELFDGYRIFYKKKSNKEGSREFLKERIQNK